MRVVAAFTVVIAFAAPAALADIKRHDSIPEALRGAWAPSAQELTPALLGAIGAGEVVRVKGSLGSRMAPLVAAVRASLERARPGGT